ncbi:MAG: thiamine phosphate synthase [Thermodesulfovibrionales bacterium]|nr:thiamine phosphate synthase [Thermodesulfovibrionales bacterium]
MRLPYICAITTVNDSNLIEHVLTALSCGIRWIQYRQKNKTRRHMYEEAIRIRQICKEYHAIFTVNDHLDIALAVNADFVHLGQDDIPVSEAKKIIPKGMGVGVSTHNLNEARTAAIQGADYIGFGPIFHTKTKDAGLPKGISELRNICQTVSIPVIAIGGINRENIYELIHVDRLSGVAISSGIFDGDIQENVRLINETYSKSKEA